MKIFIFISLIAFFSNNIANAMKVKSYKFGEFGAVDTTLDYTFDMNVNAFKWACQKKPTDYGYILETSFAPCKSEYSIELLAPKFKAMIGPPTIDVEDSILVDIMNRTLRQAKIKTAKEFMRKGAPIEHSILNRKLSSFVEKGLLIPNQVYNFIMLDHEFNFAQKYKATKDRFAKHRLIAKNYPAVQYAGEFIYVVDRNNNFVEFRISSSSGTFRPLCSVNTKFENDDAAKKFLIKNFNDLKENNIKTYCYSSDSDPLDGINDGYNSTKEQKGNFVRGLELYTDYVGGDLYYESNKKRD